jgi:hypothetical protein
VPENTNIISAKIENLIQRYQTTLNGDLLTALRRLENSTLISAANGLPMMFQGGKQIGVRYRAFPPEMTESFVVALAELGQSLAKLSKEFRFERDFRAPCDLSYQHGLERLQLKDDIDPKIGTGRFENQAWQPPFAKFSIGEGPPPP